MKIRVSRFDPLRDSSPRWEAFDIDGAEGETVLGFLQRIRESADSTLAFRYGCRFKGCGLCTVTIDGRSRLACMVKAKEGMEVGPLGSFPVIRDVVIDRRPMTALLARHRLYVVASGEGDASRVFNVPQSYDRLVRCTECLACIAECHSFELGNQGFGGPLVFVKLAQLHFDPRDGEDRRAQAKALGVSACLSCKTKCRCPVGVPIYRGAIEPLL